MSVAIGQQAAFRRTMTQRDFDRFAILSGDDNPIHVDAAFAATTHFGGTVAHGMFLYSNICRALGLLLPGAVQFEQVLMFPNPTYAGDEVTVSVEVTAVSGETAVIATTTARSNGLPGCQGAARLALSAAGVAGEGETAVVQSTATQMGAYQLGQRASLTRTFTPDDVTEYVDLVGDENVADGRLPGALLGSLFSCLLGTELPGRGTNWLKQSLRFPHLAHVGEAITATVEIIRLRPEKHLVNLRTTCANPAGEVVCTGEALVLAKEMA
ncbi:MAG: MaoC family dehydratase [Anaerolinea sp.]|nr:MaoC family dehydratase [Anaerolinea sp.]